MFQTWNRTVHPNLYVLRHTAGHSVDIHLIGLSSLWFHKNLMGSFLRKPYYFILNRRAVTRSRSKNPAGKEGRAVKILPKNLVCLFICVCDVNRNLFDLYLLRICLKGKWNYGDISILPSHL